MRQIRGRRISMLLQDPFTMLNPLMRSGPHIEEMLATGRNFRGRAARTAEVARRLAEVGITDPTTWRTACRSSSPAACASAWRSPPRSPATRSC